MDKINFECKECGLTDPHFSKQDALDHVRSHRENI